MQRYDITAAMYNARYAEEQEAKYKAALASVNVAGAVMDVGCGTGLLFSHVSAKLLLQAKKRAKAYGNVHVVRADADHLPVKADGFTTVFAFTVLQNMPKPAETLLELKRAAKRDGAIVVSGLKKTFALEAFEHLLQQAGLRVVSLKDDAVLKCYVAVSVQDL
jgi:ubiquinone/menaquinone biosynthesis C-methylase UbiE